MRRLGHLLGRNTKMLVKLLIGRAGAKAAHADKSGIRADDGVPALADACLDRDVDLGFADQRRLLRLWARRGTVQSTAPIRRARQCCVRREAFALRPRWGLQSRSRTATPRPAPLPPPLAGEGREGELRSARMRRVHSGWLRRGLGAVAAHSAASARARSVQCLSRERAASTQSSPRCRTGRNTLRLGMARNAARCSTG